MTTRDLVVIRSTSRVFQAGDSRLWETPCGGWRLRYVRRVAGVAVRPHWLVLAADRVDRPGGPIVLWEIVSRHRLRRAALERLLKLIRQGKGGNRQATRV